MRDAYLTVVIPAYKEAARIGRTLHSFSLFRFSVVAGDVIVVLDGGGDGTARKCSG